VSEAAAFGRPHRHFRRTDSTNARAKELAMLGAPSGLVVTADEQDAGRGRQGRTWFAPPGGALLYTALLRPLGERRLLPLAVPLAVCEAVEALAPVSCRVKWPNDVWVEGRKLAGVLIESRPESGGAGWAVIGVGLNIAVPPGAFPEELSGTAATLHPDAVGGAGPTVPDALTALNLALARWVATADAEVLAAFRERDALAGRRISWDEGAESGEAAGIDEAGHLLVEMETGGRRALGAGEVHLSLD
jgi:BirA family transcriptional regulator, biotin operon repressor / biotin---[acetyl-CoA-carboxylase] ligase